MPLSPISFRFAAPVGPHVTGGGGTASGRPDWVLLHKSARISGHRNATTAAECRTAEGQRIQVSFWLVDPPGVSYFSVHCPGLDRKDFADEPYILCADAALVLFAVDFVPVHGHPSFRDPARRYTQRFVYRAGPGKPSLHLVPAPDIVRPNGVHALLPSGGGEHYAVVFLHRRSIPGDKDRCYDLHVFSSVTRAWSSKPNLPGLSEDDQRLLAKSGHGTDKVIKVGASSLGYVDLCWGILLLCDVFSECPVIKYIPLPASRVCNMDEEGDPYMAPEHCCDVSSCDSLIKFVEVEFDDRRDRRSLGNQGWKATTWIRDMLSRDDDDWRVRSSVHVANISVDPSFSHLLPPELWNDETKKLELKKLVFYTPTLSKQDDDDFIYVMCKLNNCEDGDKAWVICVDMKHAAVEAIVPYSTKGRVLAVWHCPCAFPKYLELTPEDDVTQNFKSVSAADCVLQVLLSQDWFMELDKCLEFEGATYDECRPLLHSRPVSSLLLDIQEVVKYASDYDQGEATAKAVDVCSRALEDFNVLLKSPSDPLSCTEALMGRISIALGALDSFLRTVPPTVRVLADTCHRERRRAKSELRQKRGQAKPGNTTDMSFGRTNQNNYQGNKWNQSPWDRRDERVVDPDHRRQLERWKSPSCMLMILFTLSAYVLTLIVLKLLGYHPSVQ